MINKIENLISQKISIIKIHIVDNSHKHKNHQQDTKGGHFSIFIISNDFNNMQLIERHRLIYHALKGMIKSEIHALSISAQTISERNEKEVSEN